MLFNGEQVGDGDGRRVRRRRRPDRRHHADAPRACPTRSPSWPWPSAARCTTRRRSSTWRSSSPDRRPPTSSTSPRRSRRTSARVAKAKGESPRTSPSCILDRPRHDSIVREIRETGARIKFITDGDVAGAIMAAREGTGVDLLLGIGGTPEGIIAACALKCLGGVIQGRLWPQDDEERQKAIDAGHDLDRVLTTDDLVTGDNVFFVATGITDGELLRGVRYRGGRRARPTRWSCARAAGTIRLDRRASTGSTSCAPTPPSTSSTPRSAAASADDHGLRRDRRRPRRPGGRRLPRLPGRVPGQRRAGPRPPR